MHLKKNNVKAILFTTALKQKNGSQKFQWIWTLWKAIISWIFFYENQRKVIVYRRERKSVIFKTKVFLMEENICALCQQLSMVFNFNFEIYLCNYMLCSASEINNLIWLLLCKSCNIWYHLVLHCKVCILS